MKKRQLAWDVRLEAGDAAGAPEYDLVLSIYDTVVSPQMGGMFGGVSADSFYRELKSKRKAETILVRINSGGGSVTEGFAIYNLLMEHPARVTTQVDGLAGSIASIIMMAGQERLIARNGVVMIHNPFAMIEGEAVEMRAMADVLDRHAAQMLSIYATRADISVEQARTMCDATTWMSAAEAVSFGFCTGISDAEAKVAAAIRPEDLGSVPDHIAQLLEAGGDKNRMKTKAAAQATITAESVAKEAAEAAAAEAAAKAESEAKAAEAAAQADKAKADATAEMEAMRALLASKDEEINALKASLAKFGDDEEEEDDPEAKAAEAVIAAARAVTGKTDLAEVEGTLMVLADAPKADPAAAHTDRVNALVKDGKLPPARREWALGASAQALDTYLAATGGMKVGPVGTSFASDDDAARKRAGMDPAAVQLTPEEIHVAKSMGLSLDLILQNKRQTLTGVAQ